MSLKVKTIRYERIFSLGKWENERIGFEINIDETDDAIECFNNLKKLVLSLSEKSK